jgi:hypothetical protein
MPVDGPANIAENYNLAISICTAGLSFRAPQKSIFEANSCKAFLLNFVKQNRADGGFC